MPFHRFSDPSVKAVFESYPQVIREALEDLRETILGVGDLIQGVGPLEETLKWGQPAYRFRSPDCGATIRIGTQAAGTEYGLFLHNQTTLIDDLKALYRNRLRFSDDRAVVFAVGEVPPVEPLKHCIALALTFGRRSAPVTPTVRPPRRLRSATLSSAVQ